MQAAFVDIGEKKNTFIHLRDILPKVDVVGKNTTVVSDNNQNIKNIIRQGQNLLVQVKRDSTDKKGARVSTHISLPGKFLVFMPETEIITISQKIEDKIERDRLIKIVKENLPKNCGAIVRTAACKKSDEEIISDIKELNSKWKNISSEVENYTNTNKNSPKLIAEINDLTTTFITSLMSQELDKITVNAKELYSDIAVILEDLGLTDKVKLEVKEKENLLNMYELEEQLEDTKKRKVWLKCGGFITIDTTEALVAIDVNSGKYTGNTNLEQTVFTVNKEATIEIVKQLRLKDIGGIIIVDYIDMKEDSNKDKIIKLLNDELKKDRAKTQVEGFTKLNLLEMTRKHVYA